MWPFCSITILDMELSNVLGLANTLLFFNKIFYKLMTIKLLFLVIRGFFLSHTRK